MNDYGTIEDIITVHELLGGRFFKDGYDFYNRVVYPEVCVGANCENVYFVTSEMLGTMRYTIRAMNAATGIIWNIGELGDYVTHERAKGVMVAYAATDVD